MRIFYQHADLDEISSIKEIELKEGLTFNEFKEIISMDYNFIYLNQDLIIEKNKINKTSIEKDFILKNGDLITFSELPAMATIIGIIINIAIGFILRALMPKPKEPDTGKTRSIYSTQIDQIEAATGSEIQVQFGKVRSYPKLISGVYSYFDNQVENTVIHTCSGLENLKTIRTYLNETPLSSFNVSEYKLGIGSRYSGYDTHLNSRFQDSRVRYISHKCQELENISLNDNGMIVGRSIINSRDTKINKVLINFNFAGGLNDYNDDGDIINALFTATITIREVDYFENETGFVKIKNVSYTEKDKNQMRFSEWVDLPPSRYKVEIKRTTGKSTKGTSDCSVQSVFGFDENSSIEGTERINFYTFLVKANKEIANSSNLKINIHQERVGISTLKEAIVDIWTNKDYGLGLDIDYLEIREELNETCNFLLDKKESGYEVISNILKSYGYIIYPYISKFVIIKDGVRRFSTMVFNYENSLKITYSYNSPSEEEKNKGVRVRYLKEGDINFSQYEFPTGKNSYNDLILYGISDYTKAKNRAIAIYNRQLQNLKIATIETSAEGFIPEIGSRITVSSEYIDDNISTRGKIENNILYFSQKINLKQGDSYIITNSENKISRVYDVYEYGFLNKINISGIEDDFLNQDIVITLGNKETMAGDYIITSIDSDDKIENVSESINVKIIAEKYNEEVYSYV